MASGDWYDDNDEEDENRDCDEKRRLLVTPELRLTNERRLDHDLPETPSGDVSSASLLETSGPSVSSEEEILFDPREWVVIDVDTGIQRAPRQNEYLELLLQNARYRSYVSWTDQGQGLFEIRRPADVVSLWQKVKNRQTTEHMNYDTFARGIRHYYKSGLMTRTNKPFTFCFNRAYQRPN